MISYDRDPQQTIPESSVKIIGLGGAGANMLDRATLDGMTGRRRRRSRAGLTGRSGIRG